MRLCFDIFKTSSALILDNCCELCCVGLEGKGEGKTMSLRFELLKLSSALVLAAGSTLYSVDVEGGKLKQQVKIDRFPSYVSRV